MARVHRDDEQHAGHGERSARDDHAGFRKLECGNLRSCDPEACEQDQQEADLRKPLLFLGGAVFRDVHDLVFKNE